MIRTVWVISAWFTPSFINRKLENFVKVSMIFLMLAFIFQFNILV